MATLDLMTPLTRAQAQLPQAEGKKTPGSEERMLTGSYDDAELIKLWQIIKRESYDNRWTFERQWQRNLWYVLGRQWIEYQSKYGGWRDKRMASWIPRPVTNKCKETVQAIRAMFSSIYLSVNVRPNGSDAENVACAAVADEMIPLLQEAHGMHHVMSEFDFWLLVTGNAFLHSFVDYDIKHGELVITQEQCQQCQNVYPSTDLVGAQPVCPDCGGTEFEPALDEQGQPLETREPKGVPSTMVLSPLELAFPNSYTRFEDLPYVVRARWRTRRYYESHPVLKDLVSQITWQKSAQDHSLALFTSLTQTNDLGITPIYWSEGSGRGGQFDEGLPEYEVWMKPTAQYPEGLVFRVIGDASPIVVHLEDTEGLPGPLPYTDAENKPLFTFAHATYEHVGGRLLGSGPLDVIIQKQDQLNQLDSLILLIIQRMANPVWLEPKGAEIQKLTGMPGLVIKWNPLTVGGNAKPERIAGVGPDSSLFTIREQYLRDIEELAGTFDVLKGQKPSGVEAFSALQLLVERSQARFASVFASRGDVFKKWAGFALELERKFGPDERTKAILTPARSYVFKTFKRAQLRGAVTMVVEDGSTTPKTSLGMRASVEHANNLGMLNMSDPDQQYEGLKLFGLTRMVPTLDIHVQAVLQKQQAFEQWVSLRQNVENTVALIKAQQIIFEEQMAVYQQQTSTAQQLVGTTDPMQPLPAPLPPPPQPPSMLDSTPLKWRPWYNAQVHLQEFYKWANDDHVRDLIQRNPIVEQLLAIHMQEIVMAMPQPPGPIAPEAPGGNGGAAGAAMAMSNANRAGQPAGGAKGAVQPVAGKQTPPKQ